MREHPPTNRRRAARIPTLVALALAACLAAPPDALAQRRGGGGRAGGARMGGGMTRPAPRPNVSRPAARPTPAARPQARPAARPNPGAGARPGNVNPGGMTRPATRPNPAVGARPHPGGAARPNPGTGRPNLNPGPRPSTRPSLPGEVGRPNPGGGAGARPLPGPGNRPGPGPGNRPGPGGGLTRPANPPARPTPLPGRPGNGAGGNRPGLGGGDRPTTLPGRPGPGPGGGGNRPGPGGGMPGAGGNRPGLGGGGANRPGLGNRPGGNNLGQIGDNLGFVNRPNLGGNNVVNRPNYGGNVVNRPNFGGNTNINKINNITNISNNNWFGGNTVVNGGGWGGGRRGGRGWGSPYYGYHGNWYRGGWATTYPRYGYRYGSGARYYGGWGGVYNTFPSWSGYALAGWGLASLANNWLFSRYANPYYVATPVVNNVAVVQAPPAVYDYSQPIDVAAAPPEPTVAERSQATLDAAIAAFGAGDYAQATAMAEQALALTPDDPAIHEFRALALFAQGRYQEAASALYAVLTAGPGWNWSTMIGLYPDADAYTAQLRALEAAVSANPNSAPERFVLAYHYLVQSFPDAARAQFQAVAKLQPNDALAARFVELLTPQDPSAPDGAPAPAPAALTSADQAAPTDEAPPAEPPPAELLGRWRATPADGLAITLTLNPDATFTWDVNANGQDQAITGQADFRDGVLSLAQADGPPLVGQVQDLNAEGFGFQLLGSTQAPPLQFRR
jgi:tetratricopeptide (TPR) repeat protein